MDVGVRAQARTGHAKLKRRFVQVDFQLRVWILDAVNPVRCIARCVLRQPTDLINALRVQ